MTDDEFRAQPDEGSAQVRDAASQTTRSPKGCSACVTCHRRPIPTDPASFDRLSEQLWKSSRQTRQTAAIVCSISRSPPNAFAPIAEQLGRSRPAAGDRTARWRRLIVEKPFGTDLASAKALNARAAEDRRRAQIYRIDHYLGKETVQNIMVLRFANGMFEPIWNRNHIDHVQITVAEKLAVEHRGSFYDATGALRDMVPNHLFQLLSLMAMEPPARFDARCGALREGRRCSPQSRPRAARSADAIRCAANIGPARSATRRSRGYRRSADVKPDSTTETYVALKLTSTIGAGPACRSTCAPARRSARKRTEVAIKFKQAPFAMFRDTPVDRLSQNYLVISIQPDEGITLQFNAKVPGPTIAIDGVEMKFRYKDYFKAAPSTGYETLIYDCMIGDDILFQRADGVEAGWQAVQPFLDAWKTAGADGLVGYKAGSEGPTEANELLARDGRRWRKLT